MNYIHRLESEKRELHRKLGAYQDSFTAFRQLLASPKFVGHEKGERKDWIATGDVTRWLSETEQAAINS